MLRGFWLRITTSSGVHDSSSVLIIHQGGPLNDSRSIEVGFDSPVDGRFVEILLPAKGRQLSLCEVEVFGGTYMYCSTIRSLSGHASTGSYLR